MSAVVTAERHSSSSFPSEGQISCRASASPSKVRRVHLHPMEEGGAWGEGRFCGGRGYVGVEILTKKCVSKRPSPRPRPEFSLRGRER